MTDMRRMGQPELLAPAGDQAALKAALLAGADAVYLAGRRFGARAFAPNFDEAGLRWARRVTHALGRRLYVTLNTLVFDAEWRLLDQAIDFYEALRPDALIIQDLGVAEHLVRRGSRLARHLSTQAAWFGLGGTSLLRDLGISRIILPRELSLAEIQDLAGRTPFELEVFVHGAMCYSVSGRCFWSIALGSRSGNRGTCAQPCRKPYREEVPGAVDRWPFSPQDLRLAERLADLRLPGVAALKIEGRMKGADYVYHVVRAYRDLLDGGGPSGRVKSAADRESPSDHPPRGGPGRSAALAGGAAAAGVLEEVLGRAFSRASHAGFLDGPPPGDWTTGHHPGREGVPLGEVVARRPDGLTEVRCRFPPQAGDGVAWEEPSPAGSVPASAHGAHGVGRPGRGEGDSPRAAARMANPRTGQRGRPVPPRQGHRTAPADVRRGVHPASAPSARSAVGPAAAFPVPGGGRGGEEPSGGTTGSSPHSGRRAGERLTYVTPVPGQADHWLVRGLPADLPPGTALWRTSSGGGADWMNGWRKEWERTPVDLFWSGHEGQPLAVETRLLGRAVRFTTAEPLRLAVGAGLESGVLADKCTALGEHFRARRHVTTALGRGLFVPLTELKKLKRSLVEALLRMERLPPPSVAARPVAGAEPLATGGRKAALSEWPPDHRGAAARGAASPGRDEALSIDPSLVLPAVHPGAPPSVPPAAPATGRSPRLFIRVWNRTFPFVRDLHPDAWILPFGEVRLPFHLPPERLRFWLPPVLTRDQLEALIAGVRDLPPQEFLCLGWEAFALAEACPQHRFRLDWTFNLVNRPAVGVVAARGLATTAGREWPADTPPVAPGPVWTASWNPVVSFSRFPSRIDPKTLVTNSHRDRFFPLDLGNGVTALCLAEVPAALTPPPGLDLQVDVAVAPHENPVNLAAALEALLKPLRHLTHARHLNHACHRAPPRPD